MKITRMLSLLLCLALLCSTMLGTAAFAADPMDQALVEVEITAESTMAIEKDPNGMVYFETIEDLYELVSKDYDTMTNSYCPEKLVITKSITIPKNFEVYAEDIVISKDATVVVNGFLGAGDMRVEGSVVNNQLFYTNEYMEITGHVQNNASFNLFYIGNDITLIGSENITHSTDNALVWQCWLTSGVLLEKAVQSAGKHPEWIHYVYTSAEDSATLYLENSVTMPGNLQMDLMGPTTINMASGASMNISGAIVHAFEGFECNGDISLNNGGILNLGGAATINGDVTNGADLGVHVWRGGSLKLNGDYTEQANGAVYVWANEAGVPDGAITGLNVIDFAFRTEAAEGMYVSTLDGYFDSSVALTPGASVPMFRMYDPNSSEHFYTGSTQERYDLLKAGWNYEGVGFNFPAVGEPVYRLYHEPTGEHLYTMDGAEIAKLEAAGWNVEGIAFNSATASEVPQYRLHNPNATRGAYHFTGSTEERDNLISLGWENQGIGWYSCLN